MGFMWNGIHTRDLGLYAEAQTIPLLPQVKLYLDALPGKDGFIDYTRFNSKGVPHYEARDWVYRLSFEEPQKTTAITRMKAIAVLFNAYSGTFIADEMPDMEWDAIITNKIDITRVARILYTFGVTIKTQAAPAGGWHEFEEA